MKQFTGLIILLICLKGFSQEYRSDKTFNNTIAVYSGIGYTAIRNEYFDKDKYQGQQLPFGIEWKHQKEKDIWRLYCDYRFGNIHSEYDDADINQLSLGYDYSILLSRFTMLGNKASLYAGPSTFAIIQAREQPRIAVMNRFTHMNTWSVGLNVGLNGHLSKNLSISTTFSANILSYVSQCDSKKSWVTFNNAFISHSNVALLWHVLPAFNLGLSYQSDFYSIKKWDTVISGSDGLLCTISFNL